MRGIKRIIRHLLDPVILGACANVLAVFYMLLAMYVIHADVPDRELANKAITLFLGAGVSFMVLFWMVYIWAVLKRWKAENFRFSLKLDPEEE